MKMIPMEKFEKKLQKLNDAELLREEGKLLKYRLWDYDEAIKRELIKRGLREAPEE
jgi:hypothetical protein